MSLLLLSLAGVAQAAEPEVTQLDDHRVRGSVEVAVSADTARTLLADPRNVARIDNSGTTVTLKGDQGGCQLVHSAVAHPIASIAYDSKVCPTADGWRATLVKSDDLQAFESVWRVEASGTGTRIQYEVRTIPDIPVPQFIVDRQTRESVRSLLVKLRTHLEAGG